MPMFDLRKLFARESRPRDRRAAAPPPDPAPASDYHPSTQDGCGLEVEYQAVIAAQFRRLGITSSSTTIEVRRIGQGPQGYDVLVGMVRLHHWERASALRLMLGLPMLEARIRKVVRGTWLADYSHFGGLWLHASEHLHTAPGAGELRELIRRLAPSGSREGHDRQASPEGTAPPGETAAEEASRPG